MEGESPTELQAQEKTPTQEQRATLKRRNLQHCEDRTREVLVDEGQNEGLWSHKVSLTIGGVLKSYCKMHNDV